MGQRKIVIRESAAKNIAQVAFYIESKGLVRTANRFVDDAYDHIEGLANDIARHALCKDPERAVLGLKCKRFRKYTIIFAETEKEIIITEFLPSRMIHW